MVVENDPLKPVLNSIQVAFAPLESDFHKIAKNLEHFFNGIVKNELLNLDDCRKGKAQCVGMDREKCRNNGEHKAHFWHGVDKVNLNLSKKKRLRERYGSDKDSCFLDYSSERVAEDGKTLPFQHMKKFLLDQLSNLPIFDVFVQDYECSSSFKVLSDILKGKSANLKFARVKGVPSMEDKGEECSSESELLRSRTRSLESVSLTELVELLPQIGRSSKKDHPDKEELLSVQDFFGYTQAEAKRFFEEMDRDGDGRVTLEDLEITMKSRNLPRRYAKEFLQHTRTHFFSTSFRLKEFLFFMEQKEASSLRAYTSLRLNQSAAPQKDEILTSLKNAGLSATEDNAMAMMHFLNAENGDSKSYGHFRNFMALLPSNHLPDKTRRVATATDPPRVEIRTDSVLKTALAGGISCSFSTFLMHPIDTVKTQVQASTTLSFTEILSKLPQLGLRGLYMGSIPAIVGQFASHGLRTGTCEVTKIVLINVAPSLPEIQVESVASFLGTFLGTTMRIPCEVLKQRLQAGQFNHVGEALLGTWRQDGPRGFFRGTAMTLCRELPFYVAGSGLYTASKKAVQRILGRELEPWETIAVGAISGGLTAVLTTPFDVIKTRMMIALEGQPMTMSVVALSILRQEGPLGLFRGAVPRFFWVAPLGAINFAGYELIRKAMG